MYRLFIISLSIITLFIFFHDQRKSFSSVKVLERVPAQKKMQKAELRKTSFFKLKNTLHSE